ncbi:hypothetical protein Tco_1565814 [Tanacetum coccineum]
MPHLSPYHQALWQTLIRRMTSRRIMLTILLMEGMVMMSLPMMTMMMMMRMRSHLRTEDDEEEEEYLLDQLFCCTIVEPVLSASDIEAFETDESAPTPRPPQTIIPFSQTRLHRAWKIVRLEPPMSAFIEACIARHVTALTTSPYTVSPITLDHHHFTTTPLTDIPEVDMPPRKRACLTTPALGFEVRESSTAGAARQPGPALESDRRRYRVEQTGYGITDT